jgi:hypothetical protein
VSQSQILEALLCSMFYMASMMFAVRILTLACEDLKLEWLNRFAQKVLWEEYSLMSQAMSRHLHFETSRDLSLAQEGGSGVSQSQISSSVVALDVLKCCGIDDVRC